MLSACLGDVTAARVALTRLLGTHSEAPHCVLACLLACWCGAWPGRCGGSWLAPCGFCLPSLFVLVVLSADQHVSVVIPFQLSLLIIIIVIIIVIVVVVNIAIIELITINTFGGYVNDGIV